MTNNQELFKQAILDAKAVRETAMAAARTTLAEHFEPHVKEMFNQTIAEEEDNDGLDEAEFGISKKETPYKEKLKDKIKEDEDASEVEESAAPSDSMDEATLDEILAELNALSEEDNLEEGHNKADGYNGSKSSGHLGYDEKNKVTHGDHKLHEAEDEEGEKEASEESGEEPGEEAGEAGAEGGEAFGGEAGEENPDEQEVVDITVGELKDIIRDVFMQLQGGEESPEGALDAGTEMSDEMGVGEPAPSDDEISLEEILAELEAEEQMKEVAEMEEIPGGIRGQKFKGTNVSNVVVRETALQNQLNEAVKTIKALKAEFNAQNLFNSKLLYANKIFKAKNLNEAQKTKVINAFDRATSVKEVENTYKTLLESANEGSKKSQIKESVGFASKPIGSAPARPIVEADAFVTRWQQLAGIK